MSAPTPAPIRSWPSSQLTTAFYLMPRQRLTRTLQAKLPKRGRYLFLGCRINGGDLLGLQDDYRTLSLFKEVVVMPRRAASPSFDMLLGGMIGDISVNRFIFEDPMLTIGFSDYTGREPMRDISWTQSARLGRMMVKNYDHTIDLSVTILLNVQSVLNVFEEDDKLEECCSIARSVCEQLESKHIQYSFLSNAIPSGTTSLYTDIEQGLGSGHFYGVMEFRAASPRARWKASPSPCSEPAATVSRDGTTSSSPPAATPPGRMSCSDCRSFRTAGSFC